jgi:hypothetical protein
MENLGDIDSKIQILVWNMYKNRINLVPNIRMKDEYMFKSHTITNERKPYAKLNTDDDIDDED